jgi:hypothetical protein
MCLGTPNQFSENGVKSTTTNNGTMNMRSSVRALGRFTVTVCASGRYKLIR